MILNLFFIILSTSWAVDVVIIDDFSSSKSNSHGIHVENIYKKNFPDLIIKKIDLNEGTSASHSIYVNYLLALQSVAENPPLVLNLSLGSQTYNHEELSLLKRISENGTFIVTAAGNSNSNLSKSPVYPCSYKIEKLLCIGALSQNKKNPESNWGIPVKFFADGSWVNGNATSFSTPVVGSIIAKSIKKNIDPFVVISFETILINGTYQWKVSKQSAIKFFYDKPSRGPF